MVRVEREGDHSKLGVSPAKLSNPQVDQTVRQADQTVGEAGIVPYNKAEQIAIADVGCKRQEQSGSSSKVVLALDGDGDE